VRVGHQSVVTRPGLWSMDSLRKSSDVAGEVLGYKPAGAGTNQIEWVHARAGE